MSSAPSAGVSRPPRLLLVAPQPFFAASGTPLNVRLMCRVLGKAGYEVHLATLAGGEDVALPGLHHHRTWRLPGLGRIPVGFSLAKLAYTPLLAGLVFGLLLSRRFQAVQALEEAAFYAVPLARLFRCLAVADLDSDLPGQLAAHPARAVRALAGPARALRRLTLRLAHGAVVVAPSLARLVAETAPATRVALIRDVPPPETLCPPDPAETAALARELGLEGAEVVAYTGNLDRRQGVDLLVEAFASVRAARPRAVLLVVGGESREVAALAGRVQAQGLADAVRLAGRRPATAMPACMALARVLVSPRQEPLVTPLKIYAYMASGRPIVATDLPTHSDVLPRDAAFLVSPTAAGLAAGILEALADPQAAAARAARARALVRERHGYATFKAELLAFHAAISRPGGAAPGAGDGGDAGAGAPGRPRPGARLSRCDT